MFQAIRERERERVNSVWCCDSLRLRSQYILPKQKHCWLTSHSVTSRKFRPLVPPGLPVAIVSRREITQAERKRHPRGCMECGMRSLPPSSFHFTPSIWPWLNINPALLSKLKEVEKWNRSRDTEDEVLWVTTEQTHYYILYESDHGAAETQIHIQSGPPSSVKCHTGSNCCD